MIICEEAFHEIDLHFTANMETWQRVSDYGQVWVIQITIKFLNIVRSIMQNK